MEKIKNVSRGREQRENTIRRGRYKGDGGREGEERKRKDASTHSVYMYYVYGGRSRRRGKVSRIRRHCSKYNSK